MKIAVYRQPEQNNVIVELAAGESTILLDGGISLEENEGLMSLKLQGDAPYAVDAVFLSHCRSDYTTLGDKRLKDTPVYASKLTARVVSSARQYKARDPFPYAGYFTNEEPIVAGKFSVTPFLIDDAAYDGYLLLIEAEGKRIVYTGDYRANGRKGFEEMLAVLPAKADMIICEGGVIAQEDVNLVTERDIEEQAAKLIASRKGPVFLLQSVTDYDRAVSMFRAGKREKRVFLEDLYMSQLAMAAGKMMPNPADWTGVRAYLTTGYKPENFRYQMFSNLPRISLDKIATEKFIMCIRPSMKKYIKTLSQRIRFNHGILINSLRGEEWNCERVKAFLTFAAGKGLEVVTLRSSGHADAMALKALIEATKPDYVLTLIPGHGAWLKNAYPQVRILSEDNAEF